jgi:hypothetical protein
MRTWLLLGILACEPPKAPQESASPGSVAAAHVDACRDDIPDCAAACALRETSRSEFLDFYDRRCASVILGHNPDKVALAVAPPATAGSASASSPSQDFPPDVRASLMVTPHAPFDPNAMSRTGGSDPPECKAARILRAQRREHEADMLDALCIAKGGDAGT